MKTNIPQELKNKILSGEVAIYPDATRSQMQEVLLEIFPEDKYIVPLSFKEYYFRASKTNNDRWIIVSPQHNDLPAVMLSALFEIEESFEIDFPMDDDEHAEYLAKLATNMLYFIYGAMTAIALITIILSYTKTHP